MSCIETSSGTIKLKELNALELVKLQGKLVRKIVAEYKESNISEEDYLAAMVEIFQDRFEFFEGMTFIEALNDMELVQAMIYLCRPVFERFGEISKKKNLLKMPTTSTQEALQEKN